MAKINGIVRIMVDGNLLESKDGAELDLGGEERTLETGFQVYGFTEKIMPSGLTCEIVWKAGTPIEVLRAIVDGVINFEGDNGITYTCDGMVLLKPPKLKGPLIPLEFGGNPATPL
jgi:hypothetical protein